MKTIYNLLLAGGLIFCPAGLFAQNNFEQYRQQQQKNLHDFQKKRQLEFANFLQQRWESYEVHIGKRLPVIPEPEVMPIADVNIEIPDVEITFPIDPVFVPLEKKQPFTPIIPTLGPTEEKTGYNKAEVKLQGYRLIFSYDPALQIHLANTTENEISRQWAALLKTNYAKLLNDCAATQSGMALNDWAYYQLIKKIAENIYTPAQKNEKILFTAFMLNNSNRKARMAIDEASELLLLLAFNEEVFDKPYLTIGAKKYYLMDSNKMSGLRTYNDSHEDDGLLPVQLCMFNPLDLNSKDITLKERNFKSDVLGKQVCFTYNPLVQDIYKELPSCGLPLYFNTECSTDLMSSIEKNLQPALTGKNDKEKVQLLLSFLHEFPYKTDEEQFGTEKYFFSDEMFIYPYSDCEDHAILFARLVRKFTGLKVIGLQYDGHVATAVKFNEEVGGAQLQCNNESYTVCDPTYFGSRIGQCMPEYLNKPAKFIEIR